MNDPLVEKKKKASREQRKQAAKWAQELAEVEELRRKQEADMAMHDAIDRYEASRSLPGQERKAAMRALELLLHRDGGIVTRKGWLYRWSHAEGGMIRMRAVVRRARAVKESDCGEN